MPVGNGLFCRLKTILRKKKKKIEDPQPEKNEQPTPVPQRSTPFPKADISMRKQVAVSTVEGVYPDYLFDAAHSPQVLSVRHSLRLDVVPDYQKRIASRPGRSIRRTLSDPRALQRQSVGYCRPKVIDVKAVSTASPAEFSPVVGTPIARVPTAKTSATQSPMMDASGDDQSKALVPISSPSLTANGFVSPAKRTLTLKDFVIFPPISSGSWGSVFGARHCRTGIPIFIKRATKPSLFPNSNALKERGMLLALAGTPGILELLGSFHDQHNFYLVTPYYAGRDLAILIEKYYPLPQEVIPYWAAQLLSGLEKIHAHGIVHRDLKPANIFITTHGKLVIGDFGLSEFASDLRTPRRDLSGTLAYLAPEVWEEGEYSFASDVWAYAVVLFEMTAGRLPLDPSEFVSLDAVKYLVLTGNLDEWLGGKEIPALLHSLLDIIFKSSKAQRHSVSQLTYHEYFDTIDLNAISAGTLDNPHACWFAPDEDSEGNPIVPIVDDTEYLASHDSYPNFTFVSPILAPPPVPTAPDSTTAHFPAPIPELIADDLPSPSLNGYTSSPTTPAPALPEVTSWDNVFIRPVGVFSRSPSSLRSSLRVCRDTLPIIALDLERDDTCAISPSSSPFHDSSPPALFTSYSWGDSSMHTASASHPASQSRTPARADDDPSGPALLAVESWNGAFAPSASVFSRSPSLESTALASVSSTPLATLGRLSENCESLCTPPRPVKIDSVDAPAVPSMALLLAHDTPNDLSPRRRELARLRGTVFAPPRI